MSILAITQLNDGEWVNDAFSGTIHSTAQKDKKAGGHFWVGKISDAGLTVNLISFNQDLRKFENAVVEINGQGMKRGTDSYDDDLPKVSVGDKVIIKVIGDAVPNQTPAESSRPTRATAPAQEAAPATGRFGSIQGASVGNGITNAVSLITSIYTADEVKAQIKDGSFIKSVASLAGGFVKVGLFVGDGNLEGYPEEGSELTEPAETATGAGEEEDDPPF